jgi:hypothetical protein
MEIRWVARLDEADVLRLWWSWTGYQIYEAHVVIENAGTSATFTDLNVEQHPDRYTGRLEEGPALFERVLISAVNHLSHFRAGHTPYGPSSSLVLLASDGQYGSLPQRHGDAYGGTGQR